MDSVTVGLDIGSSGVRAAEIAVSKDGRRVLRHYGQVGLPIGYVVDGEVVNIPGVAAALRRLWTEGGFTRSEVVLGVSGPRVFVRQADVAALSAEDLRTSLKFDAQELVPIPMDDASFDFSLLGPPSTDDGPKTAQRILLVAAHREVLRNYVSVLKEAGLSAKVMDAAPLALMRAVAPVAHASAGSLDVIVSIGAELTTVGVRQGGVPRFVRSLTVGGQRLTDSIANSMHLDLAVAERLKRGGVGSDVPQLTQAMRAVSNEMRDLAEDVRATIDFFMSQSDGAEVNRLLITGGAAQTEGLAHSVAGTLPVDVRVLDPLDGVDTSALGFSDQQLARVRVGAVTAIGLALWPTEEPLIRLSILPEEVHRARAARKVMAVAAGGVAGLVGVLAVVGAAEVYSVHSARDKVHSEQAQATALTAQVSRLSALTAVHSKAAARSQLVQTALHGDLDWVRVLGQLATVMPPQLSLGTFSGTRTESASPSTTSSSGAVGTVSFNVKGSGGLPSVSAWLQALATDPDFSDVVVSGITVTANGGTVTFSSTATLTPTSLSNRDRGVQ